MDVNQPSGSLAGGSFANVTGNDSGTAYEYQSGTFYMSINADENYTLLVEEAK